ncbi:hypothetical protein Fmac_005638 [Flemingia macrophylla]|uniref:DUF4435 domain-containing protein n=1 Tax=Flemingia macrophylla TaxID=520843 RepID=A0ABD1N8B2_9FABA
MGFWVSLIFVVGFRSIPFVYDPFFGVVGFDSFDGFGCVGTAKQDKQQFQKTKGTSKAKEENTEKILYGLDDIVGQSDIIIVEGEMDKWQWKKLVSSIVSLFPMDKKYRSRGTRKDELKQATRVIRATDGDPPDCQIWLLCTLHYSHMVGDKKLGIDFSVSTLSMVPRIPIAYASKVTNGILQALKLFENEAFTCEYNLGNTEASGIYASRDHSIFRVQNLIERCMLFHMSLDQCIRALAEHAGIKPLVTVTVWKELQKENKEFFRAYLQFVTPRPFMSRCFQRGPKKLLALIGQYLPKDLGVKALVPGI